MDVNGRCVCGVTDGGISNRRCVCGVTDGGISNQQQQQLKLHGLER